MLLAPRSDRASRMNTRGNPESLVASHPGNQNAVKHGVHSFRLIQARAAEIATELTQAFEFSPADARADSTATARQLRQALSPRTPDDQNEGGAGAPGRDGTRDVVDRVSLATVPRTLVTASRWDADRVALRSIARLVTQPDQGAPTVDRAWRVVPNSRVVPDCARARPKGAGGSRLSPEALADYAHTALLIFDPGLGSCSCPSRQRCEYRREYGLVSATCF